MIDRLRGHLHDYFERQALAGKLDLLLIALGIVIVVSNVVVFASIASVYARNATLSRLVHLAETLDHIQIAQLRFRLTHARKDAATVREEVGTARAAFESVVLDLFPGERDGHSSVVRGLIDRFETRFDEYLLIHEQSQALDHAMRREVDDLLAGMALIRQRLGSEGLSPVLSRLGESAYQIRIIEQEFLIHRDPGLARQMALRIAGIVDDAALLRARASDVEARIQAFDISQRARRFGITFSKLLEYSAQADINERLMNEAATALSERVGHAAARERTSIADQLVLIALSIGAIALVGVISYWLIAGHYRDKIRQAARQLYQLATEDALTGLANRRQFQQRFDVAQATNRRHRTPCCVAIADLDGFKRVNDVHGHAVGDQVLVQVARQLQTATRAMDSVARWGGEEFVLLIANTELPAALTILERIREAIAAPPIATTAGPIIQTVSFGVVAVAPEETLNAVIVRADHALYLSKHSGRNRVTADPPVVVAPAATPKRASA